MPKITRNHLSKWFSIIVFSILFIGWIVYSDNNENFDSKYEIDYYVITMKSDDRLKNISDQTNIINNEKIPDDSKIVIQQIDAVVGANLNLQELVDSNVLAQGFYEDSKRRRGQLGCTLSHLKIYDIIKDKQSSGSGDYSVIFEDDFEVVTPEFINIVNSSLEISKDEDFDMLLLGNNQTSYGDGTHPKNKGENVKENVYQFNPNIMFFGTHAILINNKNIQNIIDSLKYITEPIDQQIYVRGCEQKINILTLYPCIVEQLGEIKSTIEGYSGVDYSVIRLG